VVAVIAAAADGSTPSSSISGALIMPPPMPNIPDTAPAPMTIHGKYCTDLGFHWISPGVST
jgi:hypothetical protein